MAFWITDNSREWVEAAEAESGHSTDAVWAAKLLSDDLMRWSRWWLGLGAFVLACVAAAVPGPLITALIVAPPPDALSVTISIVAAGIAAAILVICVVVLWQLHRSGRRLARSLRWWLAQRAMALPDQGFAGWAAPRAALFNPAVFVRVMTSAFSGLFAFFGFTAVAFAVADDPGFATPAVLWSVLGTACLFGQLGGVMKLVAGLGDADPLWSRIRGR